MSEETGVIDKVSGPVVWASKMAGAEIGEVVHVGEGKFIGEIIRLAKDTAVIQVYESTSGVKPGEPVYRTKKPLRAELGPGLISSVYDGIQRPLEVIREKTGYTITRGVSIPALLRDKKWFFTPTVKERDKVLGGDILGVVEETSLVQHFILLPPFMKGEIKEINEGEFTVKDPIGVIQTKEGRKNLYMKQEWPVRIPRPVKERLRLVEPLLTGQRIIDTVFPIPKGGTAAIPGGFGTGKTVMLHQIAKWADAKVIIYIGCGERGNEMTDVLKEFPELTDPKTGEKLIKRTILIANTSNMPVAAREASIYMGVTLGEYYRDQGYDVAVVADSTSRWAEALREISGRLEEMPAERGYPAYLPTRLAEFYERAGRAILLGSQQRLGSVTIMGAVSPPGGDFSEPVTQHTKRFISVFWALDKDLAFRRHFPAINWITSYSQYVEILKDWWVKQFPNWYRDREEMLSLLTEASRVEEIAKIIGESALPDDQQLTLLTAYLIKEGFLTQNAFSEVDSYCFPWKQSKMLSIIMEFYREAKKLISKGVPIDDLRGLREIMGLVRMKEKKTSEEIDEIWRKIKDKLEQLAKKEVEVIL